MRVRNIFICSMVVLTLVENDERVVQRSPRMNASGHSMMLRSMYLWT
jgi:hypothetical protein